MRRPDAPARRLVVPAACAGLLVLGLAGRLLPAAFAAGPAAFGLLLAPGFAVWRALDPRRPAELARDVPASVALGLGVHALALAATFLTHRSLHLTLGLVLCATALAAALAARAPAPAFARPDVLAGGILVALAVPIGVAGAALVRITVDMPFHTARVRKLMDVKELGVNALDELVHGGPHPGYAFPLWHELVATAGSEAGVPADQAIRGVVLGIAPVAALVAAALARLALRASHALAAAAGCAALVALGIGHGAGPLAGLGNPAESGADLLVPALYALVLVFAERRSFDRALALAAAAGALAVVHPTYVPFALLALAGAVSVAALGERHMPPLRPIGAALAIVLAPFVVYAAWVRGIASETASAASRSLDADLPRYGDRVSRVAGQIVGRPTHVLAANSLGIAALAALPGALVLGRRGRLVLGLVGAVVAFAFVPPLFRVLLRVLGLAQAHRIGLAVPTALVLCAGVRGLVALAASSEARIAAAGLVGGVAALLADMAVRDQAAVIGAVLAAVAVIAAVLRPAAERAPRDRLAAIALLAMLVPFAAVHGPTLVERATAAESPPLTAGLVRALRALPARSVILSDRVTAYDITAYTDDLVYMVPLRNVAQTKANDTRRRYRLNAQMLDPATPEAERRALFAANEIRFLVVRRDDRTGAARYFASAPGYRRFFADGTYLAFRLPE